MASGTPSATGGFGFTVTATDSSGGSGPYSAGRFYSISIVAPNITFTPANLPDAQVGAVYSQTITGIGGTAPYKLFTVAQGALPPGMTLSSTGVLGGTPTANGTFNFTISAKDSTTGSGPYTGGQNYSIKVTAPVITLIPANLPDAQVGAAYNQTITGNGGTAPYKTFTIASGALPSGLSLSSTGSLHGTATAGGSFTFAVSALDSSTGTGPFGVTQSYTLKCFRTKYHFHTRGSSPCHSRRGLYAAPYPETAGLRPTAHCCNYSRCAARRVWRWVATEASSGTATAGGAFSFTISAKDSTTGNGPFSGSRDFTLVVDPPAIVISPVTLPNAAEGANYNQMVTATGGHGTLFLFNFDRKSARGS